MFNTIRNTLCIATLALSSLIGAEALAAETAAPGDTIELSSLELEDGPERFDAAAVLEGTININTASAAELAMLPGVGPTIAERIVAYRGKRPFKQVNHLQRVKGIGSKTYTKVKPYLAIEGDTSLHVVK